MRRSVSWLAMLTLSLQAVCAVGQTPCCENLSAIERMPVASSFTLPAPFIVESDSAFRSNGYVAPPPRRGLVVHGHFYDDYAGDRDWLSPQVERAARERCGTGLRLPPPAENSDGKRIVSHFWIVRSGNEQVQFSYRPTYTGEDACVARTGYKLDVGRALLDKAMVTQFNRLENGYWHASTFPRDGSYSLPSLIEPTDHFALESKKLAKHSYRPEASLGVKQLCFYTGNSLDRAFHCHLDQPGPWRGLILSGHFEHTATTDSGMQVDQIALDAWIDSRLFEWDRDVSIANLD